MARRRRRPADLTGWEFGTFKMLMDERAAHSAALAKAERRFAAERDRRNTEVGAEREKALRIKETADEKALVLAQARQSDEDTRRNEILSRWNDDRSTFITRAEYQTAHQNLIDRFEQALAPVEQAIARSQGGSGALNAFKNQQIAVISVIVVVVGIIAGIVGHFVT